MTKEFRDKKSLYMIGLVLFSFLTMVFLTRGDKLLPIVFGILFLITLIIFMIINYKQKHPEVILSKSMKKDKHSGKVIYKKSLSHKTKETHHSDLIKHMRNK